MLEPRLYRATLFLGVAAAIVLMFSVASRPDAVRSDSAADAFAGGEAAALAREIVRRAPDREPGSAGDDAIADLVRARFEAIEGGQVLEQEFDARYEGEDVALRNVVVALPGSGGGRLVIAAARDCPEGVCAVSSAAATGALLELADAYDGARHRKTLVFASLDGSAAGAAGARELARSFGPQPPEAAIVILQPAAEPLSRPHVVPWSSGPQSTAIQLIESAKAAVETELPGSGTLRLGTFQSLMRLAIPAGLGDQAPMVEAGIDAIALSSAGDRPLDPAEDTVRDISGASLSQVGRAVLALVLAFDGHDDGLAHGPEAYVPLAGKLIPGWSLALLALALLLPVGVVSLDALARSARQGEPVAAALAWTLSRTGPFVLSALLAYALALVGLMPDPAFPFDPRLYGLDAKALLLGALLLATLAGGIRLLRLLPAPHHADWALPASIGMLVFAGSLGVWLANPYLALLLVPTIHLWFFASLLRGRLAAALALAAAGLVLPLAALVSLAAYLGAGIAVGWQLVLMFTGHHFGPLAAVPLCVLGGCLVAVLSNAAGASPDHGDPGRRSPLGPAGPGALGGPQSAHLRR